jgi:hypothetical protein
LIVTLSSVFEDDTVAVRARDSRCLPTCSCTLGKLSEPQTARHDCSHRPSAGAVDLQQAERASALPCRADNTRAYFFASPCKLQWRSQSDAA